MVLILVDLGNKLGIGQEKDAGKSSMLFAEIDFYCLQILSPCAVFLDFANEILVLL